MIPRLSTREADTTRIGRQSLGSQPTHGPAVVDRHVVVAAGIRPALAAPITDTFRGTGVSSRMQADIQINLSGRAEQ